MFCHTCTHTRAGWFIQGLRVGKIFTSSFHLVLYVLIKYYLINKVEVGEKFEVSFHPSMSIHKHLGIKLFGQRKLYD